MMGANTYRRAIDKIKEAGWQIQAKKKLPSYIVWLSDYAPKLTGCPNGFYRATLHSDKRHMNVTVTQLRNKLETNTGCSPESFQLLAVTHNLFPQFCNGKKNALYGTC